MARGAGSTSLRSTSSPTRGGVAALAAPRRGAGLGRLLRLGPHHLLARRSAACADPWVTLSAIAMRDERLRLGPMVTPPSRRRVQKLTREAVTLDHLSGGRLVLGLGLGSDRHGELAPFGEVVDPREQARMLDAALERLTAFWDGEFEPRPLQRPRIPIWLAARWPHRRPIRRAARWDGVFPIDLPGPEAVAELVAESPSCARRTPAVRRRRHAPRRTRTPRRGPRRARPGVSPASARRPREADVRAAIDAGP